MCYEMVKRKQSFGKTKSGNDVYLYSLENKNGMSVEIISYGAAIRGICLSNGQQVVVGYNTFEEYETDSSYLGAIVGRVANRISNAHYKYDLEEFQLSQNNGKHHLHGGVNGLSSKNWEVVEDNDKLVLKCFCQHLEDGYPGDLEVNVSYQLNDEDELSILIEATSTKTTPLSITAHPYFNLGGTLHSHFLEIYSKQYLETNNELIPTGRLMNLSENEALNFGILKELGLVLKSQGLDLNYCFNETISPQLMAYLTNKANTTSLKIYSTYPGLQVYSADFLPKGNYQFHEGGSQSAICLEPQFWPNFVNNPDFNGFYLNPNQIYAQQIVYKFETVS